MSAETNNQQPGAVVPPETPEAAAVTDSQMADFVHAERAAEHAQRMARPAGQLSIEMYSEAAD